jgi:hypothetical protein
MARTAWPAPPPAQAQLLRTHRLQRPRPSEEELRSFERMLTAADATATARHALRLRVREASVRSAEADGGAFDEDAAAHLDALMTVVESVCGAQCPYDSSRRGARVTWAASRLTNELRLLKRPRREETDALVRSLAAELLARVQE